MKSTRLHTKLAGAVVAAVLATAVGASAGEAGAATLPAACSLLTRSEAQTLARLPLQRPTNLARRGCLYTSRPTGPPAQVEIYVDNSLPRTLEIDRQELHHRFWKVPRLGDQSLEEEWTIFARRGSTWITIHLLRLEPWPTYRSRLEHAARLAIGRVGSKPRSTATARTPTPAPRGRWTDEERRYGGGITQYAGVVYQPAVVLIGGGAHSIRARSADGLSWTIDGSAPGVSRLRVGKIMVATTFATGRVLKLTPVGSDVRVLLGPVTLTDIVRDGEFRSSAPIPVKAPIRYRTQPPKSTRIHRRTQSASTSGGAVGYATPICCEGGIGVHLFYHNAAGKLSATMQFHARRPTIAFHIRIGGGKLIDSGFQLRGVGGLRYDITGATFTGRGDFRTGPISVPESVTIPLAGPLAITITQSFDLSMQFVGRATVQTTGDYAFMGTLGFGYGGGAVDRQPLTMQTATPMGENTLSLGVGSNSISIGYALRATVGVGAVVFTAGAWGEVNAGLALTADGSNIESLNFGCTTVAIDVKDKFGVGYAVADFVRKPINAFLGLLRIKPIPATGGPEWGPFTVWHPADAQWCPPRKGSP